MRPCAICATVEYGTPLPLETAGQSPFVCRSRRTTTVSMGSSAWVISGDLKLNTAEYYPFSDRFASWFVANAIPQWISVFGKIAVMTKRPIREILADNVRRLMRERPALDTQPKLAAKAGMSQSSINRLLAGQTDALLVSVLDLAKALGVSVNDLIEEQAAPRTESIVYDRERYANLPAEEKAKIATFIEFVIATHASKTVKSSDVLNIKESIKPTPERSARVQDASQKRLSRDALNTNENENHTTKRRRRSSEN